MSEKAPSGAGSDLVIKGGRIIDESGERSGDVVVRDGVVVAIGPDLSADVTIDAGGCVVAPGLVDLHTHLRQPGKEEAETIETGLAGGCPRRVHLRPGDAEHHAARSTRAAVVREVQELGRTALCDVEVSGAITVGSTRANG